MGKAERIILQPGVQDERAWIIFPSVMEALARNSRVPQGCKRCGDEVMLRIPRTRSGHLGAYGEDHSSTVRQANRRRHKVPHLQEWQPRGSYGAGTGGRGNCWRNPFTTCGMNIAQQNGVCWCKSAPRKA